MRGAETYLSGRVGPFALLMATRLVRHVRVVDDWTATAGQMDILDLRRLFGTEALPRRSLVSLTGEDEKERVIALDCVGSLHAMDDSQFLPLPSAFRYASTVFDAVCSQPIEGIYGLRVRCRPTFVPMHNDAHRIGSG